LTSLSSLERITQRLEDVRFEILGTRETEEFVLLEKSMSDIVVSYYVALEIFCQGLLLIQKENKYGTLKKRGNLRSPQDGDTRRKRDGRSV